MKLFVHDNEIYIPKDINRESQIITIKAIDCIVTKSHYAIFFFDSYVVTVRMLLGEIEEELHDLDFFRIRREKLINLARLDRIISYEKREILMKNGDKFIVSKRNFAEFKRRLIS